MEKSNRLGLNLPKRGQGVFADVNDISEDFEILDEASIIDKVVNAFPTATLALLHKIYKNKLTGEIKRCIQRVYGANPVFDWSEMGCGVYGVCATENMLPPADDAHENQKWRVKDTNTIYKLIKKNNVLKWVPESWGTGGGGGSFAVIQITYPQGDTITVDFNGTTYDAPDDSGIWMFGCEEAGTYVVKNGDESQSVTITIKGEIRYVNMSPANYKFIYYKGEEYEDVTGGWEKTEKFDIWHYSASSYDPAYDNWYEGFKTKNKISRGVYTKVAIAMTWSTVLPSGVSSHFKAIYVGENIAPTTASQYNTLPFFTLFKDTNYGAGYISYDCNVPSQSVDVIEPQIIGFAVVGSSRRSATITNQCDKLDDKLQIYTTDIANGKTYQLNAKIKMVALVKEDDISGLSAYGDTIDAIISKAVDLFNDEAAVKYMVKNCTGDFMMTALNGKSRPSYATFIPALKASPYKHFVTENVHWAKFIDIYELDI